jgi:uncharacterized membrane protein
MEKVDLRNAKLMGGIGAILPLVGSLFLKRVYGLSFILSITSIVLILMALNEISNKVGNHEIFSNYFTGFILQIIGYIVFIIFAVVGGLALIFRFGMGFMGGLRSLGIPAALLLFAFYILIVVSFYYVKKSFDLIGESLSNPNFKTAGLLLFIGAILLIVFGIGVLVMFVGEIFEIVGFFTLPDEIEKVGTQDIQQG